LTVQQYQDAEILLKINFASGTGDAPEDWYVVYADASTNLVQKYPIVTLKANKEEAEKNPHAYNI
jgi:hypothetical protein